MDRPSKRRVLEFLGPIFLGIGFVVKLFYKVAFGWSLDPWMQGKQNRALWDDVQANFYFLTSQTQLDLSGFTDIHPFDYASVKIPWENLLVTITRGRGNHSGDRLTASCSRRQLRVRSIDRRNGA